MSDCERLHKPSRREILKLREVKDELNFISEGALSPVECTLPKINAILDTELMMLFCPIPRATGGFELERLHTSDPSRDKRDPPAFTRFLFNAPPDFNLWNPMSVNASEANVVVEPRANVSRDLFAQVPVYRNVIVPIGLGPHGQLRILLCEGPTFLGWFGAFSRTLVVRNVHADFGRAVVRADSCIPAHDHRLLRATETTTPQLLVLETSCANQQS